MRRPVVVLALLAVLLAPALVLPRAASAAEPEAHFEPASGDCNHEWVIAGSGYPAGSRVTIEIPGMTDSVYVAETRTGQDGAFRAVLPSTFPDQCRPGALIGLAATTGTGADRVWRMAAYEVASPYSLRTVRCSEQESTFIGSGFPPGSTLQLLWVQDMPFAHSAAIVGSVTADAAGVFEATFHIGCLPAGDTIVTGTSEVGVRLDSQVPSPATTGHGLARSTGRGVPIALAMVGLAILGGARVATGRERGA